LKGFENLNIRKRLWRTFRCK